MQISQINSFDGKPLSLVEWNDVSEPTACVQLVHSKGEHAERYNEFSKYLNGRGYLVFAVSLRGHGKTDEFSRGSCFGDIWNESLTDIAFLAKKYKEKYPKLNHAVIGFGYGSFLAIRFAEKYKRYVDGLVVSSCYATDNLAVNRLICALLHKVKGENFKSKILNKLAMGGFNGELDYLSSDVDFLKNYQNDEMIKFDFSNGFYKSYFKGISKTLKRNSLEEISSELPTYIISGEQDKLGKYGKTSEKLKITLDNLGVKCVKLKIYPTAKHDLLNDVCREEVRSDIAGFLDLHIRTL